MMVISNHGFASPPGREGGQMEECRPQVTPSEIQPG